MDTENLAAQDGAEVTELADVKRKMRFNGTVIKTTLAGAVVDIGLETPGVVHISQLKEGTVNRVEDVVQPGQQVEVWVRRVFPKKKRIELTMIEPLALEWRDMQKDMVVKGKVTRLEKFGVFVDIGAERPGLVHISELTHDYIKNPSEVVKEGDEIEVKILNVNRHKRQIKLSMKALEEPPVKVAREVTSRGAEEPLRDEPVPTAMEMALREAMERSKQKEEDQDDEKSKGQTRPASQSAEINDILARTLQQKRGTNK